MTMFHTLTVGLPDTTLYLRLIGFVIVDVKTHPMRWLLLKVPGQLSTVTEPPDTYSQTVHQYAVPGVFSMVVIGFHLSHGVSSMFQSIGFRNEAWRYRLNAIAMLYCIVIALGFSINPLAVLVSKYTDCQILPVAQVEKQFSQLKDAKGQIFVNYDFLKEGCKPCTKK